MGSPMATGINSSRQYLPPPPASCEAISMLSLYSVFPKSPALGMWTMYRLDSGLTSRPHILECAAMRAAVCERISPSAWRSWQILPLAYSPLTTRRDANQANPLPTPRTQYLAHVHLGLNHAQDSEDERHQGGAVQNAQETESCPAGGI